MTLNPAYVTKKVERKENEEGQTQLTQRQDNDYDIWSLEATETDKHKGNINITSPDPRSYADELQKGLVRSDRSIAIHMGELEGEDERDNISKLERLFDFTLARADERLRRMGLISLKNSLVWYSMVRGFGAVRILNNLDKDKALDSFYLPVDPRWLTYEYGDNGLLWVAYKTFRTKADLQDTYKYEPTKDVPEVIDYWEWDEGKKEKKATNAVVCEGEWLKAPKSYEMRRLPFLILPVGTRPVVVDEQGIRTAGYGDSIYSTSRGLVPIINKALTMWATWANIRANTPLLWKAENMEASKELELFQGRLDAIVKIPKGDEFEALGLPEISATLVNLVGQLLAQWQRATAPFVVFGDVTMPSSGTAISELKEAEEKAYFPYLTNLDAIYTDMCYMIEEQLIDGGLKFEVDGLGRDKRYYKDKITPVDIKRPHIIRVEHRIKSKYGEFQALQMAQMSRDAELLSLETIMEKILKIQDPKREIALIDFEKIRRDPIMLIVSAIGLLQKEGRTDEAGYLMDLANKLGSQGPIQMSGQTQAPPTAPMGGAMPAQPPTAPVTRGAI